MTPALFVPRLGDTLYRWVFIWLSHVAWGVTQDNRMEPEIPSALQDADDGVGIRGGTNHGHAGEFGSENLASHSEHFGFCHPPKAAMGHFGINDFTVHQDRSAHAHILT